MENNSATNIDKSEIKLILTSNKLLKASDYVGALSRRRINIIKFTEKDNEKRGKLIETTKKIMLTDVKH